MTRDFTGEKKEELYRALEKIDDREWKSFRAWCGGRTADFGEWPERLAISDYTGQIDRYQDRIVGTNDSTREQIDSIFERVAEIDRKYAGIFLEHAETVKEQIARVSVMTEIMRSGAGRRADIKTMLCKMDNRHSTQMEYAKSLLDKCLEEKGYINQTEREFIIDIIGRDRPDLLEELYNIKSYNVSFWEIPMKKMEDYYHSYAVEKHPCYKDYYFGRYPYPAAYINGILKKYEKHKMVDGRFVLDNGGSTIAYGHDIVEGEDFSDGLSEEEGLELALCDLDEKYEDIVSCIGEINDLIGTDINVKDFSENEMIFLLDFSYNRGRGLVKRSEIPKNQPHTSLALLIKAVSKDDDKAIVDILKEEVNNRHGEYYEGLEQRRMDEYEILKQGDYERNEDMERGVW